MFLFNSFLLSSFSILYKFHFVIIISQSRQIINQESNQTPITGVLLGARPRFSIHCPRRWNYWWKLVIEHLPTRSMTCWRKTIRCPSWTLVLEHKWTSDLSSQADYTQCDELHQNIWRTQLLEYLEVRQLSVGMKADQHFHRHLVDILYF